MNASLKKTAIAAVAALALGAGVAVSTTAPAEAGPADLAPRRLLRRPLAWRLVGPGDWPRHPRRRDRRRGDRQLEGRITGQAPTTALAPTAIRCWQPRPMYDAWGRYIGNRMVNACY